MSAPLVSLHLYGVSTVGIPVAVARMGLDRRPLRRTPGLRFWKLLGTGDGRTFTVRDADPRHWGLVAVWEDAAALAAFEAASPVAAAWGRLAEERWRVDLEPVRTRGTWGGQSPFTPADADAGTGRSSAPVAAITRARLVPARALRFWKAVPPVSEALQGAAGLRLAVGIGEAPIGLQGTFSLWDSSRALADYAYRTPAHRAAVDRTPQERWYAEELFARFRVLGSQGTVFGSDPLRGWDPAADRARVDGSGGDGAGGRDGSGDGGAAT